MRPSWPSSAGSRKLRRRRLQRMRKRLPIAPWPRRAKAALLRARRQTRPLLPRRQPAPQNHRVLSILLLIQIRHRIRIRHPIRTPHRRLRPSL